MSSGLWRWDGRLIKTWKQNHSFWFDRPWVRREHVVPPTQFYQPYLGLGSMKMFWWWHDEMMKMLSRTPPCSTWDFCFVFCLNLSKGWSINIRHKAHWRKGVWDRSAFSFVKWLNSSSTFSQIFFKGAQKKTYQKMLGLRYMRKEKEKKWKHYEHCSSASAWWTLIWNTSS